MVPALFLRFSHSFPMAFLWFQPFRFLVPAEPPGDLQNGLLAVEPGAQNRNWGWLKPVEISRWKPIWYTCAPMVMFIPIRPLAT